MFGIVFRTTGTFADGYQWYPAAASCAWLIQPPMDSTENTIFLDFTFVDTETDFDKINGNRNTKLAMCTASDRDEI